MYIYDVAFSLRMRMTVRYGYCHILDNVCRRGTSPADGRKVDDACFL